MPQSADARIAEERGTRRFPASAGERPAARPSPPGAPAALAAAADEAGADALLQEGGRAEAFAIGVEEDFRGLEDEARGRLVHQLEGAHRVAEAELAGGIDVLRRRHPVLDEADRLGEKD